MGSRNSGKSYDIALKLIFLAIQGKLRIILIRKYQAQVQDSQFALIKQIIDDLNLYSCFRTVSARMVVTKTGSTFIMKGMDKKEKIKSIVGDIVWIEEAFDISKEDYLWLRQSFLRGKKYRTYKGKKFYKQIYLSFNPTSKKSWLKEHFFDVNGIPNKR